jgi:hypothetical protein
MNGHPPRGSAVPHPDPILVPRPGRLDQRYLHHPQRALTRRRRQPGIQPTAASCTAVDPPEPRDQPDPPASPDPPDQPDPAYQPPSPPNLSIEGILGLSNPASITSHRPILDDRFRVG